MFDSKSLADSSSNLPGTVADLDQRLGLYRVFLKLYEHHRELLNEILDLENTDNRYHTRGVWQYVQGVIQGQEAYLTTNLIHHETQLLVQSQQIWVIGRDRSCGLSIQDKRLSRRHAMIQYVENQGFYLLDLNSTNGTYINGEPARRPMRLKEGDCIRLGSLLFTFFQCDSRRVLESIPPELLNQLETHQPTSPTTQSLLDDEADSLPVEIDWETTLAGSEQTAMFLKPPVLASEQSPTAITHSSAMPTFG